MNIMCICGDIYSAKPIWTKDEDLENAYIVFYEKNPKNIVLKKYIIIDGYQLTLSSFVDYSNEHFTCGIPNFGTEMIDLLEEKKKTERLKLERSPVLLIYELTKYESNEIEFPKKFIIRKKYVWVCQLLTNLKH